MTIAPSASGLDALLGLHSLEGVRETDQDGTPVLLIRLDGEVHAIFVDLSDRIGVVRMQDQQWPLLPGHLSRLHGEELEAADPGPPLVCNFIRRPRAPTRAPTRSPSRGTQSARSAAVEADVARWLLGAWHQIVGGIPPSPSSPRSSRRAADAARSIDRGLEREGEGAVCAIDESRDAIVLEIGTEIGAEAAHGQGRLILPLSSGTNVLPRQTALVTSRPQGQSIKISRLIISGSAADWIVHDVRINNLSQFAQSGDVPGEVFSPTAIDSFVAFDVVRRMTDVSIQVTYVGEHPQGAPFTAALVGTGLSSQTLVVRWTPEGRREAWMTESQA